MNGIVCAVDIGSSVIKAALVDKAGAITGLSTAPSPQPENDHGHFDAEACVAGACDAIAAVASDSGVSPSAIVGLALSSQRASLVPVGTNDEASGPAWS